MSHSQSTAKVDVCGAQSNLPASQGPPTSQHKRSLCARLIQDFPRELADGSARVNGDPWPSSATLAVGTVGPVGGATQSIGYLPDESAHASSTADYATAGLPGIREARGERRDSDPIRRVSPSIGAPRVAGDQQQSDTRAPASPAPVPTRASPCPLMLHDGHISAAVRRAHDSPSPPRHHPCADRLHACHPQPCHPQPCHPPPLPTPWRALPSPCWSCSSPPWCP